MELGVSHEQSLSSLTPIVDNTFDKYNKNLVPIRSLSDHDIYTNYFISKIVMECFHIYLYNTPIFAQSSLRQGTL